MLIINFFSLSLKFESYEFWLPARSSKRIFQSHLQIMSDISLNSELFIRIAIQIDYSHKFKILKSKIDKLFLHFDLMCTTRGPKSIQGGNLRAPIDDFAKVLEVVAFYLEWTCHTP